MNKGKTIFAQLMSLFTEYEFSKCISRYKGDKHTIKFSCRDQFLAMSFTQFTDRSSLRDIEPVDLLTEYFGRTDIEGVIKTSKEYLGLLPLAKWSADTVRGKILSDIMNTIIFLNMRKVLDESGLSVGEVTGKTQSLMCFLNKQGEILIETPNKKVKAYYKLIGETIPASLKINDSRQKVMLQ